tara:strand:+ start:9727 stop:10320 length:594 start_codon:yes stop_codon:yes gene_type:complete
VDMNFKISFKNSIRKAIKVFALLLTPYTVAAQNVNLKTDKLIYEFNDEILVQASVDAKFDSVKMSAFDNVKSISKAQLSSQSSSIKGQFKIKQTISYRLRPLDSGRIEIKSPTFYFNGKEVIGESIFITIKSSKLSENDLFEKAYKEFIEDDVKPINSVKVVFSDSLGYIERYNKDGWSFIRRLSEREIKEINKIIK